MTAAIYALSFWHYYLYWLAYRYGAIPLATFKRDAVTAKTVSLAALSLAYFATPLDLVSLVVVSTGFLLNIVAARALGSDRTYYGYEVAGLPPLRITAFPYSVIPHPMIVGNVLAFGGTLLNPAFRADWWPLAGAHVLLNLGLLLMEVAVTPHQPAAFRITVTSGCYIAGMGAVLGAAIGSWARGGIGPLLGVAISAGMLGGACLLYRRYSSGEKASP
jgi:hypothetical protein